MCSEQENIVPKPILKKRKRNEEWENDKKRQFEVIKVKNATNQKLIFKKNEEYSKEYME